VTSVDVRRMPCPDMPGTGSRANCRPDAHQSGGGGGGAKSRAAPLHGAGARCFAGRKKAGTRIHSQEENKKKRAHAMSYLIPARSCRWAVGAGAAALLYELLAPPPLRHCAHARAFQQSTVGRGAGFSPPYGG
jgi:hypothetical protein